MSNDPLNLMVRASRYAAEMHKQQKRKGGHDVPYINHPLEVARILSEEAGVADPVILAAAILHDTIEDTDAEESDLREQFGADVARIVAEVTDNKKFCKDTRKAFQLMHAPHLSEGAKLVKLADKIANLRDIASPNGPGWTPQRSAEYFAWAKQVAAGLAGVNPRLDDAFAEICARQPLTA